MVSRAGLEPATTALKDQNGLIAGVPSRDFSVHYGNAVSVDCPSVRPFGHRFGHNGDFGCGGASGAKLLENTELGQLRSASESFERVSNSQ